MRSEAMLDILQYEFMRNAIAAGILASVACGMIGVYVVLKKIVFLSDGITHASFGGIGLGYFLHINPVDALLPFSIVSAIAMYIATKMTKAYEDTAIGILLATGMAIGIIFVYLTPGYAPDLMTYLFGNILMVPLSDLLMMVGLDIVIILLVIIFYHELQALCFDEEYMRVSGRNANAYYLLLLCMVAVYTVIMVRVTGIILNITLLTIPAIISHKLVSSLKLMFALSVIQGMIYVLSGLWLSYILDLPSGATIVMIMTAAYGMVMIIKSAHEKLVIPRHSQSSKS